MAKAVAVQSVKIEVSDSEAEYLEKATKGQTSFNLRYDSEAEYLEKAKKDQTSSSLLYNHRVGRIIVSQI